MPNKVYVGNLPYTVTAKGLEQLFSTCGKVINVHIPTDKDTGRPKGIAFVEFTGMDEVEEAIIQLHNTSVAGRNIIVTLALERADKDTSPRKPYAKCIGTGECVMCHTTNAIYGFDSAYNGVCASCISSLSKAARPSRTDQILPSNPPRNIDIDRSFGRQRNPNW
jgi:RNA recognition motif-containing protein